MRKDNKKPTLKQAKEVVKIIKKDLGICGICNKVNIIIKKKKPIETEWEAREKCGAKPFDIVMKREDSLWYKIEMILQDHNIKVHDCGCKDKIHKLCEQEYQRGFKKGFEKGKYLCKGL